MTAKEARETKIFAIENLNVVETNLHDFVMISAEGESETKTLRVRENEDNECSDYCHFTDGEWNHNKNCVKCDGFGTYTTYEVYTYNYHRKQKTVIDCVFDTPEEAEDHIFKQTYNYDFQKDDQRDTMYFDSYQDAYDELIDRLACIKNTSIEVIKRWLSFCKYCEQAQSERITKAKAEYEERIDKLSDIYAAIIEPTTEGYKQTCGRLQLAIGGQRIETAVFHAAVKKIRSK